MYKTLNFLTPYELVRWMNKHKYIEPIEVVTIDQIYCLIYWEEEPQPQQKDLIPESDKSESLLGEWQICPKCNGSGLVYNPHRMSTSATDICDVCNGSKIIQKPVIIKQ